MKSSVLRGACRSLLQMGNGEIQWNPTSVSQLLNNHSLPRCSRPSPRPRAHASDSKSTERRSQSHRRTGLERRLIQERAGRVPRACVFYSTIRDDLFRSIPRKSFSTDSGRIDRAGGNDRCLGIDRSPPRERLEISITRSRFVSLLRFR